MSGKLVRRVLTFVSITNDTDAAFGDGITLTLTRDAGVGGTGNPRGFFYGDLGGYGAELAIQPPDSYFGFVTDIELSPSYPRFATGYDLPATFFDSPTHDYRIRSEDGTVLIGSIDGVDRITGPASLGYNGYFGVTAGTGGATMTARITAIDLTLPHLPTCP